MTYKPQPADPLDLATLFATLALALCPDHVRQGLIAILDEQITFLDEYRFDQLLQQLEDPDCDLDTLGIRPAIARWLQATSHDPSSLTTDYCNLPTEPLLLPPGDLQHETG